METRRRCGSTASVWMVFCLAPVTWGSWWYCHCQDALAIGGYMLLPWWYYHCRGAPAILGYMVAFSWPSKESCVHVVLIGHTQRNLHQNTGDLKTQKTRKRRNVNIKQVRVGLLTVQQSILMFDACSEIELREN